VSLCLSLLPACLLSSPFSKDVRDTIRVVYHGRQLEKSRVAVTPAASRCLMPTWMAGCSTSAHGYGAPFAPRMNVSTSHASTRASILSRTMIDDHASLTWRKPADTTVN